MLAPILMLEQVLDCVLTLFIVNFLGGRELNPIVAPILDLEGGAYWFISLKLSCAVLLGAMVPKVKIAAPELLWTFWTLAGIYAAIVIWSGFLILTTAL